VSSEVKSAYRPDRDFLYDVFQSRVIVAAKTVLGIDCKTGKPTKIQLSPDIDSLPKQKKVEHLHSLAAKVVDAFVLDQSSTNGTLTTLLTHQDREELLQQQQLTPEGRFPCRYPGGQKTFIRDGKCRRSHDYQKIIHQ